MTSGMTEYGYKEVAERLGVTVRTVQRYVKEAGIEGTLSYREKGGTKRVFSEVDMERLKAFVTPPQLPVKSSVSGMTSGMTEAEPESAAITLWTNLGNLLGRLAVATEGLQEEARQREERHAAELGAIREELNRQREEARRREEELLRRLEAIREELARPWWWKWWPWGKGNDSR